MRIRTSLPLLPLFFFTLFACNGGTVTDGGTGGGGTAGSGGTGGTGGGSALPACEVHADAASVFACVHAPMLTPQGPMYAPHYIFTGTVTVTAVRPWESQEPCLSWRTEYGFAPPTSVIDVVDSTGAPLTLGVRAPGFSPSTVAVGDTLDIDFQTETLGNIDIASTRGLRLRIERGGELLVAVGQNDPAGLAFAQGASECVRASDACSTEDIIMQMQDAQGDGVSIPNGTSTEVDGLLVTNAAYFKTYNGSGAFSCNFAIPVEYLVSAAAVP
ncbi:hypothetical protein [Polyangium sp. 15x6]|uniref:hypothetical protein n=1 Tax=Polyangium sp. 15x6 TaxID=3042687 RepID=UPI00249AE0A7|nr:hypothetical protein [Polyangium sp. 15x6]MDI3282832.1 hypothetical protein [Polyangium sp. 15x6]